MKKIIFSILALLALAGCKETVTEHKEYAENAPADMMSELPPPPPLEGDEFKAAKGDAPRADADYEQMIIKNAELSFETTNLDETGANIVALVKKYNAQVQQDSESKSSYAMSRNIRVRVANKNFENFIEEIGRGVTYFDRKEITAQDVTEEYVDLDARIKAKKTLEARYLELLKKAGKVSEMLEIEKELSAIREEIEAQEGRLRYLKSRVAMSTVNINFYKTTEVQAGATVSYGSKMWNAIKSGFNGISSFFIGLLYVWPFILIFVIAFILIRRKMKKKYSKI